ncbi:hypothetical protein [Acaryochloris sp. IP29b_bin.148]|uniref:hypothetical protein n=1 Tax=Acaryochloris sp. IP29b_bin.148 TaxID=2969218 RepID=UPI002633F443|nr:hypothetical protein [Acaryochloris sp. IP29b_bin.148]
MGRRLTLAVWIVVGVAQWGTVVHAQSFHFPTVSGRTSQESISTPDGTVCTQNTSGRANLSMGVYGDTRSSEDYGLSSATSEKGDNFGGFVMVNVPLGAPRRLDCASLLEIEYERAKLRLKRERLELLDPTEEETQNPMYK